jgi:Rrf2 family protein
MVRRQHFVAVMILRNIGNFHDKSAVILSVAWAANLLGVLSCQLARRLLPVHRICPFMLTQRSRYALRALIFIARSEGIAPVPISVIAADQKLPRKFLEIILLDLKNGGLVESFRGKMGGYRLAKPASQISFGEIIRMIEGPLALVPCVSVSAYQRCADCFEESTCVIRKTMLIVRDNTAAILDNTSLADLSIEREAA